MSRRSKEDIRRRPVRSSDVPSTDKDVEITEILEDEDDPMVLKGSRPKGPPKKLSEGTEEEWGIEDDGDWGGKSDQSQPGKETQEQHIKRIINKTNMEMMVGFLLHLGLLGFCVYVQVYDSTNLKRTGGKGLPGLFTFAGRWKYLTYINLWVQFVYFFLMFLQDIMPDSYAQKLLSKFCDFIFTSVIFPLGLFVAIAFWGIYAIDREMVYPARFDEFNPTILNHFWHTTIVVTVLLEVFLVFHHYPTNWNAITMVFTFSTGYIIWIVTILTVSDFWVYPFLKVMPPPLMSVFFAVCFFTVVGLYYLGKFLGQWRWQERHLLIEELRL